MIEVLCSNTSNRHPCEEFIFHLCISVLTFSWLWYNVQDKQVKGKGLYSGSWIQMLSPIVLDPLSLSQLNTCWPEHKAEATQLLHTGSRGLHVVSTAGKKHHDPKATWWSRGFVCQCVLFCFLAYPSLSQSITEGSQSRNPR